MNQIPERSSYMALFFAFAPHPYAEYSIRNVMHHLGSQWGLQILTNPASYGFASKLTEEWAHVNLTTINLNLPDGDHDATDILKRSADFWRTVKGDILLLFDFNTVFRKTLPIDDFLDYDYVAPLWHPDEMPQPDRPVGCGALSLRRKSAMIDVATASKPDLLVYATEDLFYTLKLPECGHIAPPVVAQAFASENDVGVDPVALRKAWIGNPAENLDRLLSTISY